MHETDKPPTWPHTLHYTFHTHADVIYDGSRIMLHLFALSLFLSLSPCFFPTRAPYFPSPERLVRKEGEKRGEREGEWVS